MTDDLERRLDAVERAITGDDRAVADLTDAADLSNRVDTLAERTDEVERRLADLEAAVRALRGYVGQQRANGADRPASDDPPAPDETDPADTRAAPRNETGADTSVAASDADGPASSGATADRESGDGGDTRRVDVDTGGEWPDWDGDRPPADGTRATTGDGSAASETDGASDVRRLDPKPGAASDAGGVSRERDGTADRDAADGRVDAEGSGEETVAWDWEWTGTESDGAGPRERTDGTGGRERSRPDGGSPGTASGAVDRRERVRDTDGDGRASERWTVASDDRGESSANSRGGGRGGPQDAGRGASARAERGWSDGGAEAWEPSADRWPDPDDQEPVDDRRPGASDDWPEGLDVERAQPWSVPDPPRVAAEEHEEDDGLLERLREAL